MSNEERKYNNGQLIDLSQMSVEEKKNAINYWCEGNQQLKKLLHTLMEKNIETKGCCSGHETEDKSEYAYIAMKVGTEQDSEIIDLVTRLEMASADTRITFLRTDEGFSSCILTAQNCGNNEKFFQGINRACNNINSPNLRLEDAREKYRNIIRLVTDQRAEQYTPLTEITWEMGQQVARTGGLYEYGENVVYIDIEKLEKMGNWLKENPDTEITNEFYYTKIPKNAYPMKFLKEKCQQSTLPLRLIRKAYHAIKNVILGKNGRDNGEEENFRE